MSADPWWLQRHGLLNDQNVVLEPELGKVPGTRLTIDEREQIALGVATGRSFADIAVQLCRSTSSKNDGAVVGPGPSSMPPMR